MSKMTPTAGRRTEHPSGAAEVRAFRLSPHHLALLTVYARRRRLGRSAALRELIEKIPDGAGRRPKPMA